MMKLNPENMTNNTSTLIIALSVIVLGTATALLNALMSLS